MLSGPRWEASAFGSFGVGGTRASEVYTYFAGLDRKRSRSSRRMDFDRRWWCGGVCVAGYSLAARRAQETSVSASVTVCRDATDRARMVQEASRVSQNLTRWTRWAARRWRGCWPGRVQRQRRAGFGSTSRKRQSVEQRGGREGEPYL